MTICNEIVPCLCKHTRKACNATDQLRTQVRDARALKAVVITDCACPDKHELVTRRRRVRASRGMADNPPDPH
eukprot:1140333-Pelagomonas_calceolata.AAC.9